MSDFNAAAAGDSGLTVDAAPDLDMSSDSTPDVAVAPEKAVAEPVPDLEAKSSDEALEALLEKAQSEDGRARDESGRFAKKEGEAAAADPTTAAPAQDRFQHWDAQHKAAFDGLPEPAKQAWLAHETRVADIIDKHYREQAAPIYEQAEAAKPFMQAIEANTAYLQRVSSEIGKPSEQIVANLMQFEGGLRYGSYTDKISLIQKMMTDYKIDPFDVAMGTDSSQTGAEPQVVHDLKQQIASLTYRLSQTDSAQATAATSQVNTQIAAFSSMTDAQGQPKHPFFEQVRGAMGDLIKSGRATTMDDAYKLAAKPIEDAVAKRAESSLSAMQKRGQEAVEKAKRTQPVRGSMGPRSVRDSSLDDIISSAMGG